MSKGNFKELLKEEKYIQGLMGFWSFFIIVKVIRFGEVKYKFVINKLIFFFFIVFQNIFVIYFFQKINIFIM